MFQQSLVIPNPTGIHARPASELVALAKKYESQITIQRDEKRLNAKSMLSILSGGLKQYTEISVIAEGSDESEAGSALIELIKGFTE